MNTLMRTDPACILLIGLAVITAIAVLATIGHAVITPATARPDKYSCPLGTERQSIIVRNSNEAFGGTTVEVVCK